MNHNYQNYDTKSKGKKRLIIVLSHNLSQLWFSMS